MYTCMHLYVCVYVHNYDKVADKVGPSKYIACIEHNGCPPWRSVDAFRLTRRTVWQRHAYISMRFTPRRDPKPIS